MIGRLMSAQHQTAAEKWTSPEFAFEPTAGREQLQQSLPAERDGY